MMAITCGTCDKTFRKFSHRKQHMDALGHEEPDHECTFCDCFFDSDGARQQHQADVHHYCGTCERQFRDDNAIRDVSNTAAFFALASYLILGLDTECSSMKQHLKTSAVHRNSSLSCPFCSAVFGMASGVAHHLERSKCPNAPLDRDKMYAALRLRDQGGFITQHLIGWYGSDKFEVSDMAFDHYADAWVCYICRREFGSRHSLSQHLDSPVHQMSLYHCPNKRGQCKSQFTTLAGLFQHLESESCGYMRFDAVQRKVHELMDPNRRLTF